MKLKEMGASQMILRSTMKLVCLLFSVVAFCEGLSGQEFDESFELWPVDLKINGTVLAGGGSELPEEAGEYLLAVSSRAETIVRVQLPNVKQELNSKTKAKFDEIENHQVVNLVKATDLENVSTLAILEAADVIWLQTEQVLGDSSQDILVPLLPVLNKAVGRGALVCVNGSAIEHFGKLIVTSTDNSISFREGADLVFDSVIKAGYRDETERNTLLSVLSANPSCVGIGVESEASILLSGRKIRVLGDGAAVFALAANETKPVRIQVLRQARSRRANPYETIVDLTAWRRDAIDRMGELFPPSRPRSPLVKNGSLVIVGGGGMPAGLMEEMVGLAGGPKARMVYVPCSESDEVSSSQRIVEIWEKMGVESATFIHTKDREKANSDEAFLAPLRNATGIWFGGGRQWNLADSYFGTEAHRLMKQVLDRGGVIGGSSAGASIQARYMCRANPVANFDIMAPGYERGLGFISGVAIDQHFSQRRRQRDMTSLVNRYPQLLGIGIDEATAIVVTQSNARVVGKGKVHFYDRKRPVVPGEDDFIALEEGSVFDLASRSIVEETNSSKPSTSPSEKAK
ncbi:MAG: cyanophycinase [Mariniblastus sp.]|nr:cyanophycinase [Mariniblastus sp.]MDG2182094.1 cyanophycinase [Mariniblastus sp.]